MGFLQPKAEDVATLFAVPDGPLDVGAEYRRQQLATNAANDAAKLRLLLNAESSAGLVAAEMTHAGLPWRIDVHERLLAEKLGARPGPQCSPA